MTRSSHAPPDGYARGGHAKTAARMGQPGVRDVRHSYATAGRDAKMEWKALSKRIGHADVAFTMMQVRSDRP
jgi:hypothetical protein